MFSLKYKDIYPDDFFDISKDTSLKHLGRVYINNGTLLEYGGDFSSKKYLSESISEKYFKEYSENIDDPISKWECNIEFIDTGDVYTQTFETAKYARTAIGKLLTGRNFKYTDKPPEIDYYLAKSKYSNVEEYYFNIEDSSQLQSVATHFKLEYPIDSEMTEILDNDRFKIRFKSYDLLDQGDGNWVSLVIGGIEFVDGSPYRLKFYETRRIESIDDKDVIKETTLDSDGETRNTFTIEEADTNELETLYQTFSREDYSHVSKGYNSILNDSIYTCLHSYKTSSVFDYVAIERKYYVSNNKVVDKAAFIYDGEIIPNIPSGSKIRFYARYIDIEDKELDESDELYYIRDIYFENTNGIKLLDVLGIPYDKYDIIPEQFGITFDSRTNEILRTKAYYYGKSELKIWK